MRRRMRSLTIAGAAILGSTMTLAPTVSTAITSPVATSASSNGVTPNCAWPIVTSAGTANVAFPDTDSVYWTTPYRVVPGAKVIINGRYPSARFLSFNTYDSDGGAFTVSGSPSAIVDYEINPNPGSRNPWQRPQVRGDVGRGGGKFQVTLTQTLPSAARNPVPMAPAGTDPNALGFVLMRVYLPKNGDFSAVTLPSITVVNGAERSTIKPCAPRQQSGPNQRNNNLSPEQRAAIKAALLVLANTGICHGSECPPDLQFSRPPAATTNSVFPNSASAYVSALFRPDPNRVVIVRGKAPTTPGLIPPGTQPLPWPSSRFQLRYFSLCNNLYRKPFPVIINDLPTGQDPGCRADSETVLNRRGRYTYVVAAETQRSIATKWKTATFVPTSVKTPRAREVLIFRNMLSSTSFAQSALNAPQNNSASGAAAVMGAYYPRAVSCPIKYYAKFGPDACFRRGT